MTDAMVPCKRAAVRAAKAAAWGRAFYWKVVCVFSMASLGWMVLLSAYGAETFDPEKYEVNNYFENDNLVILRDRQRDVPQENLKTILMWNDAYGVRTYGRNSLVCMYQYILLLILYLL